MRRISFLKAILPAAVAGALLLVAYVLFEKNSPGSWVFTVLGCALFLGCVFVNVSAIRQQSQPQIPGDSNAEHVEAGKGAEASGDIDVEFLEGVIRNCQLPETKRLLSQMLPSSSELPRDFPDTAPPQKL